MGSMPLLYDRSRTISLRDSISLPTRNSSASAVGSRPCGGHALGRGGVGSGGSKG